MQDVYLKEFGLWINLTSLTQFESYADECECLIEETSKSVTRYRCACHSECGMLRKHHTNYNKIVSEMTKESYIGPNKMVFLGADCCENSGLTCDMSFNAYGYADLNLSMCFLFNRGNELYSSLTVSHEFGHLYGAIDHYGGETYTVDDLNEDEPYDIYSKHCIYGTERLLNTNVFTDLIFCNGCKRDIRIYLENMLGEDS